MLTISLDEYGQFESTKSTKCLIGGVVYSGKKEKMARERERIHQYLKDCCARTGSRFPQDLHFERKNGVILNLDMVNRTKEEIQRTFSDFLKNAEGTYSIYAVVSGGDGVSMFQGDNVGNLLLDSYAGNKYRHMTGMAMHNLLINNPVLRDREYHLELATRVLVPGENAKLKEDSRHLGMARKANLDNEAYTLTDANSYIAMLSSAMLEREDKDVDVRLNVQSINYSGQSEDVSRMQGFLYLADIVCSLLQDEIHGGGDSPLIERIYACANRYTTHRKNMVWQYSDTDILLQKAIQYRIHGQWFSCISLLYDISHQEKPETSHYRDFWVERVLGELHIQPDASLLLQAATELNHYIHTPGAGTGKGWYIVQQLRQLLDRAEGQRDSAQCSYMIYSTLVSLCNHRGDFAQAKEFYQKAITHARYAPIDDYLELRNAYSVSLLDQLSFEDALENTEETKSYEELIEEIRRSIYPDADQTALHYGKTLSQLGQCYAFLEEHLQAQQHFRDALERFGEDRINLSITRSYLLHSYIESGMREEYEKLSCEYFGTPLTDEPVRLVSRQLDSIRSMDHLSKKFALFVFIKGWRAFYLEQISKQDTKRYLSQILNWEDQDRKEHPWELILRHGAVIAQKKGLTEQAELFRRRLEELPFTGQEGLLGDICRDGLRECLCLRDGQFFKGKEKLVYMYR